MVAGGSFAREGIGERCLPWVGPGMMTASGPSAGTGRSMNGLDVR